MWGNSYGAFNAQPLSVKQGRKCVVWFSEATRAEGLDDAASTVRYCLLKAQAVTGLAKDLDAGAVLNKEQMAELQLASTSSDPRKARLLSVLGSPFGYH